MKSLKTDCLPTAGFTTFAMTSNVGVCYLGRGWQGSPKIFGHNEAMTEMLKQVQHDDKTCYAKVY